MITAPQLTQSSLLQMGDSTLALWDCQGRWCMVSWVLPQVGVGDLLRHKDCLEFIQHLEMVVGMEGSR
jgi:hypothetical protein